MVARIALGLFAGLAVIGGAMLTVMVAIYFWGDEYVPVLNHVGGWGILSGAVALGICLGGFVPAHPAVRALVGALSAFMGLGLTSLAAYVISLSAHRGGPRGNLETGSHGIIWLLAGLFFVWAATKSRWPVAQQR